MTKTKRKKRTKKSSAVPRRRREERRSLVRDEDLTYATVCSTGLTVELQGEHRI
jgi:hypothetical protein